MGQNVLDPVLLEVYSGAIAPPLKRDVLHQWPGRFGLALWALEDGWAFTTNSGAAFHVGSDGRSVVCHSGDQGWSGVAAEAFVRRVLPRVVQLHGRLVLHAAALHTPAGVILLCGQSRAGKSTLAASLSRQLGWSIMSDDMAAIMDVAGAHSVLSTSRSVSLWADSEAALADAFERSERIGVYGTKYRCEPLPAVEHLHGPLRAICYLAQPVVDTDEGISVSEVEPAGRVALLAAQVIDFNPADRRNRVQRFAKLARLAKSVPVVTLHYPRRFATLPKVAECLSAWVGTGTACSLSQ